MAVIPNDLIDDVQRHLRDTTGATWSDVECSEYMNNSFYILIGVRPFAFSLIASVQLAANSTRQAIPTGDYMLLDMPRNMGADGATEGKIITSVERWQLDMFNQHYHKGLGKTFIEHYAYDPKKSLTEFYVFPRTHVSTAVFVEMNTASHPIKVTAANQAAATVTITSTGLVATVVHTAHALSAGASVLITGAAEDDYNGTFVISNITVNGYDYTMLADPVDTATGTITSKCVVILDQTYEPFVKEYMFYEAYNKNTSVASFAQSQRHLTNAAGMIGMKLEALQAAQDKLKEGA